jgi:hypothetical protein
VDLGINDSASMRSCDHPKVLRGFTYGRADSLV